MRTRRQWPTILRLAVAAILLVGIGAGFDSTARAQADKPAQERAKPSAVPLWSVNCGGNEKLTCKAIYTIFLEQPRKLLLRASVTREKDVAAMLVQVPVGPFLPAGMTIDFGDGSQKRHPFQTCDANGCYVGVQLTKAITQTMQTAKAMKVSIQNLKRKPVTITVPLNGFDVAFKKLGDG